ncbi:hypothetical protein ABEDC_2460 [Acinetobacter lwoffii]|nr:hypothetical protein ABEDC_2460 [Acinetobacter lwoffii]
MAYRIKIIPQVNLLQPILYQPHISSEYADSKHFCFSGIIVIGFACVLT